MFISFMRFVLFKQKTAYDMRMSGWSSDGGSSDLFRGQYGAGTVRGRAVAPYRQAPRVDPASETETYVALKLMIDNWRWAGVPFYIRTGKSLAARRTEITVQFKRAPHILFRHTHDGECAPN